MERIRDWAQILNIQLSQTRQLLSIDRNTNSCSSQFCWSLWESPLLGKACQECEKPPQNDKQTGHQVSWGMGEVTQWGGSVWTEWNEKLRMRSDMFLLNTEMVSAKKEGVHAPHLWWAGKAVHSKCNKKKLLRLWEELFQMVNSKAAA